MKKFFIVLLKIIMLLSFAGIIVFSTIAIINNQNVSYEAYNYVVAQSKIVEIKKFVNDVDNNVKLQYGATSDPYASFIGTAVRENNNALEYYLNYLALGEQIYKGEQNQIINNFKNFANKVDTCKNILEEYKVAYEEARNNSGSFALSNVIAKEKYFIDNYVQLYHSQVTLVRSVESVISKNIVKNKPYSYQVWLIKIGMSNGTIEQVFKEERLDIATNELANNYYDFLASCESYSDSDLVENLNLYEFVDNLKALDTVMWAQDYYKYYSQINNTLKAKAKTAKDFFDANF